MSLSRCRHVVVTRVRRRIKSVCGPLPVTGEAGPMNCVIMGKNYAQVRRIWKVNVALQIGRVIVVEMVILVYFQSFSELFK